MPRLALAPLAALALFAVVLAPSSAAASYYFEVPEVTMTVRLQPDASADIEYEIAFLNVAGHSAIDIVDVGMPNNDYDLSTMRATVDGRMVGSARVSQYVDPGVEVHLGAFAIQGGSGGTFGFTFTHQDLVFNDTTSEDLASFRITPTWFGSEYVSGSTDLKVAIILPPGVEPNEVLHHGLKGFTSKAKTGEGTVVLFHWPSTRFTDKHMVGISFPIASMERVVKTSRWQLLVKAVEANPTLRLWLFGFLALFLGIAFFRFSGGTGFVVFLMLAGLAGFFSLDSAGFQLLAIPGGLGLIAVNEVFLRKRKDAYLPPIAQVEGGGIKRGLTAPEAAVLLEEPLGKVLSLVVFGLLKKNVLVLEEEHPFRVRVRDPFHLEGVSARTRSDRRRTAAKQEGVALRPYEEGFLRIIEDAPGTMPMHDLDFTDALKRLVEMTADRLSGFDLSDTKTYYRKIIERALKEAEATVPKSAKSTTTMDRGLEWILLSERPGDVFDRYHYRPPWYRRRYRYYGGGGGGGGGIPIPGGGSDKGPGWSPTVGDAAAGYAGWAENVFGDLAGAVLPGEIGGKGGGFLDLSGVDKVTGDILVAMAESSSGGGGGGGGGCACAGCACACACAGGGR